MAAAANERFLQFYDEMIRRHSSSSSSIPLSSSSSSLTIEEEIDRELRKILLDKELGLDPLDSMIKRIYYEMKSEKKISLLIEFHSSSSAILEINSSLCDEGEGEESSSSPPICNHYIVLSGGQRKSVYGTYYCLDKWKTFVIDEDPLIRFSLLIGTESYLIAKLIETILKTLSISHKELEMYLKIKRIVSLEDYQEMKKLNSNSLPIS